MRFRFARTSLIPLALLAGIAPVFLTGCPTAQTPNTNTNTDQDDGDTAAPVDDGDTTLPRPIPPVIPPDTTVGTPGSGTGGGGGGGGGGGTPPTTEDVRLTVTEPASSLGTRPGGTLDVIYTLTDNTGSVNLTELVVARDDNADGIADGDPVLTLPLSNVTGQTTIGFDTNQIAGLLVDGFGRFVLGVRTTTVGGDEIIDYGAGILTVDNEVPVILWVAPTADDLINRSEDKTVQVTSNDNSSHSITVTLVNEDDPNVTFEVVPSTTFAAGSGTRTFDVDFSGIPAGTYEFRVSVNDGIGASTTITGVKIGTTEPVVVSVTDRLIGEFDLNTLAGDTSRGAIFQGFNFNDLAGSSVSTVPDLNNDGRDELIIGSRFGKPLLIEQDGVGWGEAYMVYGNSSRLTGERKLNSVGLGNVSGLVFQGIRNPLNQSWTYGLSDITVVQDMDGDELPEIVFSFPRVESINLGETNTGVQSPQLLPDISGMGNLEFQANTPFGWAPNLAQFTRGGVVIVSSQNALLTNPAAVNRRFGRVLDLHEVGQMFGSMSRPNIDLYVFDIVPDANDPFGCSDCIACEGACPAPEGETVEPAECAGDCLGDPENCDETFYTNSIWVWDTVLSNQGPGGFLQPWHPVPVDPPLANPAIFPYDTGFLDLINPPAARCDDITGDGVPDGCEFINTFIAWGPPPFLPFPCTTLIGVPAWDDGNGASIWTGFYGPFTSPRGYTGVDSNGNLISVPPTSIGARVLGQAVEDRFGTAVATDGRFLFISSPERTVSVNDVPELPTSDRSHAGAIYQLVSNDRTTPTSPTLTQLWLEPGQTWPNPDAQATARLDFTMPVPHQYVIEDVGAYRGPSTVIQDYPTPDNCAGRDFFEDGGEQAIVTPSPLCNGANESTQTAAYYTNTTPQIIGPHEDARLTFVRGLGDVNGDGFRDFAVGSANIREDFDDAGSDTVGGIFIVFSRPFNLEGDYLLEQIALDISDPERLDGVFIRGGAAGDTLARVFADAGDFNGDGFADVIIGNEGASGDAGEAIILLGSSTLNSPAGGWTPATIPADRVIRFTGANAGDLVGANVASAGDVDGDNLSDVLIAAPGVSGSTGSVYLIYGDDELTGIQGLANVGAAALPGVKFNGRVAGDFLGGGMKNVPGTDPNGGSADVTSQGVATLGDIDGDGADDFSITSMLASPAGKTNAGEVYVIYGQRGP